MMRREKGKIVAGDGLEIFFEKEFNLQDKIIALGFHGLGGIGHLTTRMIVEGALKQGLAERVGYFIGPLIPPFLEVLDGARVGLPYELFLIEDKVLALLIRVQPWLDDQPIMADKLTELASREGAKGFVLFGGVDVDVFQRPRDEIPLVYVGNDIFLRKPDILFPNFQMASAPKGILISGGISLFLEYATYRGVPAIAMFSPTFKGSFDKEGAFKLAKKFIEITGLSVDLSYIESEIKEASRVLEEALRELPTQEMGESLREDDFSQIFT